MLVPEKLCGVALYTCDHGTPMRLFRGPEFPITAEDLRRLAEEGRTTLYVLATEHYQFQQYLRDNLKELVQDEQRPVSERLGTLNEVIRSVLGESFRRTDLDEAIRATESLACHTVDLVCREDLVLSELWSVLYHDYHTFTHSTNVAYYAVVLAMKLGLNEREQLTRIAMGAMVHDLGKQGIPESILTKPSKLEGHEYETMKSHALLGYRRICDRKDLTFGQLMMVYQHHERLDGGGYPVGVSGEEIHEWARLCTVVDVYEALTSHRSYRAKLTSREAFTIMDGSAGAAFDRGIYECWKGIMQKR